MERWKLDLEITPHETKQKKSSAKVVALGFQAVLFYCFKFVLLEMDVRQQPKQQPSLFNIGTLEI